MFSVGLFKCIVVNLWKSQSWVREVDLSESGYAKMYFAHNKWQKALDITDRKFIQVKTFPSTPNIFDFTSNDFYLFQIYQMHFHLKKSKLKEKTL